MTNEKELSFMMSYTPPCWKVVDSAINKPAEREEVPRGCYKTGSPWQRYGKETPFFHFSRGLVLIESSSSPCFSSCAPGASGRSGLIGPPLRHQWWRGEKSEYISMMIENRGGWKQSMYCTPIAIPQRSTLWQSIEREERERGWHGGVHKPP